LRWDLQQSHESASPDASRDLFASPEDSVDPQSNSARASVMTPGQDSASTGAVSPATARSSLESDGAQGGSDTRVSDGSTGPAAASGTDVAMSALVNRRGSGGVTTAAVTSGSSTPSNVPVIRRPRSYGRSNLPQVVKLPFAPSSLSAAAPAVPITVSRIACGSSFTLAISSAGRVCSSVYVVASTVPCLDCICTCPAVIPGQVFSWGNGSHGRLGLGHCQDVATPTLINGFGGHGISRVSCGWAHAIAITSTPRA